MPEETAAQTEEASQLDYPTDEDIAMDVIDLECQRRLWIKAAMPVVHLATDHPNVRVQEALEDAVIAAARRISRCCESDLLGEW
jgi:hypothetical protein